MAQCPRCSARLDVPDDVEEATCPECGLEVRLLEVPEAPCPRCGALVPMGPGEVVHCAACKRPIAVGRPLETFAHCPRCRRRLEVGPDAASATCAHCGQEMALWDT